MFMLISLAQVYLASNHVYLDYYDALLITLLLFIFLIILLILYIFYKEWVLGFVIVVGFKNFFLGHCYNVNIRIQTINMFIVHHALCSLLGSFDVGNLHVIRFLSL